MKDVCMFYLTEAEKCISQMTEPSIYQSIFEATKGEPEAVAEETRNAELGDKSASLLQKAIAAIKAIYMKVKETLRNIVNYFKLNKDEKEKYDAFVKACKEDPSLAGKKVSVHDWKKIEPVYNSLVKEIEDEARRIEREKQDAKPNILRSLQNKVREFGGFARKTTIQVGVDQLIIRAKHDHVVAERLQDFIDNDMGILTKLEQELGKKEVRHIKKRVKHIANPTGVYRILAALRKDYADVREQAAAEERDIRNQFVRSGVKSVLKHTDGAKQTVAIGKQAFKIGGAALKDSHQEVKAKKRQLKLMKRAKDEEDGISRGKRLAMNAKDTGKKISNRMKNSIDLGTPK